jgi:hypothetical protein
MKPAAVRHAVTPVSRTRNGWRLGTPALFPSRAAALEGAAAVQAPCSHPGPCTFPFKKCDGGQGFFLETV